MFQFHPQVKEHFWNFIKAVEEYEELKESGSMLQLSHRIETIKSGMRVWANQLSPELSSAYAVLYTGYVTSQSLEKEEDKKIAWNYIHNVAKQMAIDLKDNFSPLHMECPEGKKVITIQKTHLVTYFRNTENKKETAICESFIVSVNDPCLKIVAGILEVSVGDIVKALEKYEYRSTSLPEQVQAEELPTPYP